ncbi:MAG: DASS family sodium-coupled anion symporter [Halobacteriovoraceae bacterium]|nr:DASS family sodium-coupled anion symporter [Halobacteriovoraceae bacterium]
MNKFLKSSELKIISVLLFPLIISSLFIPDMTKALPLFISVVLLWFTELIPLPITGILVPVLAIFYGLLPTKEAFSSFGHQILFLFIGSFIMSQSMIKHQLDKRVSYYFLSKFFKGNSLSYLCHIFALLCFFLSMWISNTATCAIVVPIALGIINIIKEKIDDENVMQSFKNRILLTCAFSSSIGGLATPIGSPPNLLAISYLKELGITITFVDWLIIGLPLSLIMLFILGVIFEVRIPLHEKNLEGINSFFKKKYKELGSINIAQLQVLCCFLLAIFLWILPGIILEIFPHSHFVIELNKRLPMGAVAIFSSSLLFFLKEENNKNTFTWADASQIDWGTILLFGGGLTLGHILTQSGLAKIIGNHTFSWITAHSSLFFILLLAVIFSVAMSELSSNTASAAIVIPILLAVLKEYNIVQNFEAPIIATAFGASFGFMLPVSTPPNAIIYGTGQINLKEMLKNGVIFDIFGILAISLYMYIIF